MPLNTKIQIADPDGFYQELIDSQRDMDDSEAALMNAKLVLILCNQIGDRRMLSDAIALAGGKLLATGAPDNDKH